MNNFEFLSFVNLQDNKPKTKETLRERHFFLLIFILLWELSKVQIQKRKSEE
jgi:hypothetical protein